MLIEEPENGLTPTALKRFYQAVRALLGRVHHLAADDAGPVSDCDNVGAAP
jgi:hypothetical protein